MSQERKTAALPLKLKFSSGNVASRVFRRVELNRTIGPTPYGHNLS